MFLLKKIYKPFSKLRIQTPSAIIVRLGGKRFTTIFMGRFTLTLMGNLIKPQSSMGESPISECSLSFRHTVWDRDQVG